LVVIFFAVTGLVFAGLIALHRTIGS
jgi:hypothetical protein